MRSFADGQFNAPFQVTQDAANTIIQWTSYATLQRLHSNMSLSTSFLDLGTGQTVPTRDVPARQGSEQPASRKPTDSLNNPESYEIKIPLHQVHSIKRVVPTLGSGTPYVIVSTDKGVALPPFYFTNGGIKELFKALKQCAFVTTSDEDSNLFLINDTANMLVKSLSSLDIGTPMRTVEGGGAAVSFFSDVGLSILGAFSKVPKMGRKALKCSPIHQVTLALRSISHQCCRCSPDRRKTS